MPGAQFDLSFKTKTPTVFRSVSCNIWDMIILTRFAIYLKFSFSPGSICLFHPVPSFEGCSWVLMTDPGLGSPSPSPQSVFPNRSHCCVAPKGTGMGPLRLACQMPPGALAGWLRSLWTLGVGGEGLRSCPASLRCGQDAQITSGQKMVLL